MTDLQMDTTKDAALRLCAEVVEERDAAVKLLRETYEALHFWVDAAQMNHNEQAKRIAVRHEVRAFLARLDGRTG